MRLLSPLLAALAEAAAPLRTSMPVAAEFFGMHSGYLSSSWPNISFGSMACAPGVHWNTIEKARGVYDFTQIDRWIAANKQHGGRTNLAWMYWIGTAPWAASSSGDPPTDLEVTAACLAPLAGVVTTNCMFKEFLTATLDHVCTGTAPHKTCAIPNWELHNEVNGGDDNWSGTYAQLVTMDADAVAIIKGQCSACRVTTSNVAGGGTGWHARNLTSPEAFDFLAAYLAEWMRQGRQMPDVIAWHPYSSRNDVSPAPFPETFVGSNCSSFGPTPNAHCDYTIVDQIRKLRAIADAHGMAGKPIWGTEGGYGKNSQVWGGPDRAPTAQSDLRGAYAARWWILQASAGIERTYWYAWDEQCWGTQLGDGKPASSCGGEVSPVGLTSVGVAQQTIFQWLVGHSFSTPCSNQAADANVWSCDITGSSSYAGRIVWNTRGPSSYAVPKQFVRQRNLNGMVMSISNHSVQIGVTPILLESRMPHKSDDASPSRPRVVGWTSFNSCGPHLCPNQTQQIAHIVHHADVIDAIMPTLDGTGPRGMANTSACTWSPPGAKGAVAASFRFGIGPLSAAAREPLGCRDGSGRCLCVPKPESLVHEWSDPIRAAGVEILPVIVGAPRIWPVSGDPFLDDAVSVARRFGFDGWSLDVEYANTNWTAYADFVVLFRAHLTAHNLRLSLASSPTQCTAPDPDSYCLRWNTSAFEPIARGGATILTMDTYYMTEPLHTMLSTRIRNWQQVVHPELLSIGFGAIYFKSEPVASQVINESVAICHNLGVQEIALWELSAGLGSNHPQGCAGWTGPCDPNATWPAESWWPALRAFKAA